MGENSKFLKSLTLEIQIFKLAGCLQILIISCLNIGFIHVFSCINICRVPRMLFEHKADRPSVQHHPRDQAGVNAMKQTCVIVILAYFTLFQPNLHCKRC